MFSSYRGICQATVLAFLILSPILCRAVTSMSSECEDLSGLLPGKVYFPDTTGYESSVESYFFLSERLEPTCVVTPSSAEDVALIVKLMAASNTLTTNSNIFSIRSGGHSPVAGSANANTGVTIDLSLLKGVSISDDGSVTSIGPGARWVDVYEVLDKQNLAVVGGRVGSVGVGGLSTGGGISAFSPQHGWTCDNVVNYEIVLASGAIVNANVTRNSDLFSALKGGQNNFGVVTRIDMRSFSQSTYWGGGVEYLDSATPDQLAAFTAFKDPANFDPHAEIEQSFLFVASENSTFISSNNMFYTEPIVNATALQRFNSITPQLVNTMRISNSTDFATELERDQPVNQYGVYATSTFRISPSVLTDVHSIWKASMLTLAGIANFTGVLTYQSIPPPPSPTSPPNSLGFAPHSEPEKDLVLLLLSNYWSLADDTATVQTSTQNLLSAIKTLTEQQNLSISYTYLNYAASWQNPIQSYGEKQVEMLRAVARKYDPEGLFQTKVPGGFKVFGT